MSPAYDESGITQSVEFAFSEIEPQPDSLGSIDVDAVLEMHNRLWRWICKDDCKNWGEFCCRCIVSCWRLYRPTRVWSLDKISSRFGRTSAAIKPWICSFNKSLPEISKGIRGEMWGDEISQEMKALLNMENLLMRWAYQNQCQSIDGFGCRFISAAWVFYEPFRELNQTEIAFRFAKKKQSPNRWIAKFKQEFPEIGKHLRYTKHTCKKQE